jgi:hypothetical protein
MWSFFCLFSFVKLNYYVYYFYCCTVARLCDCAVVWWIFLKLLFSSLLLTLLHILYCWYPLWKLFKIYVVSWRRPHILVMESSEFYQQILIFCHCNANCFGMSLHCIWPFQVLSGWLWQLFSLRLVCNNICCHILYCAYCGSCIKFRITLPYCSYKKYDC